MQQFGLTYKHIIFIVLGAILANIIIASKPYEAIIALLSSM